MTLLVSLQPLVDSSNPPHRLVIPFAQMTSTIKAEVTPIEHEHPVHSYPPAKRIFEYNQRFAVIARKVPCFTLQVLALACK